MPYSVRRIIMGCILTMNDWLTNRPTDRYVHWFYMLVYDWFTYPNVYPRPRSLSVIWLLTRVRRYGSEGDAVRSEGEAVGDLQGHRKVTLLNHTGLWATTTNSRYQMKSGIGLSISWTGSAESHIRWYSDLYKSAGLLSCQLKCPSFSVFFKFFQCAWGISCIYEYLVANCVCGEGHTISWLVNISLDKIHLGGRGGGGDTIHSWLSTTLSPLDTIHLEGGQNSLVNIVPPWTNTFLRGDIIHWGGHYSLVKIVPPGHYSPVNSVRGTIFTGE